VKDAFSVKMYGSVFSPTCQVPTLIGVVAFFVPAGVDCLPQSRFLAILGIDEPVPASAWILEAYSEFPPDAEKDESSATPFDLH
jgi:hypothetical protein